MRVLQRKLGCCRNKIQSAPGKWPKTVFPVDPGPPCCTAAVHLIYSTATGAFHCIVVVVLNTVVMLWRAERRCATAVERNKACGYVYATTLGENSVRYVVPYMWKVTMRCTIWNLSKPSISYEHHKISLPMYKDNAW